MTTHITNTQLNRDIYEHNRYVALIENRNRNRDKGNESFYRNQILYMKWARTVVVLYVDPIKRLLLESEKFKRYIRIKKSIVIVNRSFILVVLVISCEKLSEFRGLILHTYV